MVTGTEINERNRSFWEERGPSFDRRASNPILMKIALDAMASEEMRMVPIKHWLSLDSRLEEADNARPIYRILLNQDASVAKRGDALEKFIRSAVQRKPDLNIDELLQQLRASCGIGSILSVTEEEIEFDGPNGTIKVAPLSGLKDRLSRAKKSFRSAPG